MGNLYFNAVTGAYTLKKMNAQDTEKILNKVVAVALAYGNKLSTDKEKLALEASNNTYLYEILSSKLVYEYFKSIVSQTIVSSKFAKAPKLNIMLSNFGEYKKAFEYIGVASGDCPLFTAETITTAYENSLLAVAKPVDAEDTLTGNEEDLDGFVFDTVDEDEESPEAEITDKQAGELDIRQESESTEEETPTTEENTIEENFDPDNEKEMLDAWRKADWANIEDTVKSLLFTIGELYKSGIESMAQPGIFLYSGEDTSPLIVVKYREATETESAFCGIQNKIDSGLRTDRKIVQTLSTVLPNMAPMQGIDPKTNFPTLEALYTNEGVMHEAHLMFQSVSIPYSGVNHNKNSVKNWVKSTKGKTGEQWIIEDNRSNKHRITKYKDAEDWFRWVLENTLFRYFNEAGLKPDQPTGAALDIIDKILVTFAKKFKNVVVVAERESKGKTLQSTELRICTDSVYDAKELASNIARNLNSGNAQDITADARNTNKQVTPIRIIYDQKAAKASMVFASQIAQSLIDGGNIPKWNKVLLGRKENGEFLFWEDFMYGQKAEDFAYAIYAGSGSGKGNMTLTLMAAAIGDKRQLFYTDGKPDSGASIGALAWKDGKEMYMFDGQAQGGDLFPGYLEVNPVTNGMRDPQETLSYTHAIPKGIFQSEQEVREFLGVCRYLRSLALCGYTLTARGGLGKLKNSTIPEEDFQIWVFDEMTSMSSKERKVRQSFANYIKNKGYKFASVKKDVDNKECLVGFKAGKEYNEATDPNSEKYDKGVAYISDWINWLAKLGPLFSDLSVIGLRNAQANIFFIFQQATWLSKEVDGEITAIANIANSLKCRKFVGSGGLANGCGHYGDGTIMKSSWANIIAGGGGWWAVSDASDIRQSGTNMTIFKPYSIWGFRKKGAVGNDDRYFDYYCNLMLGAAGVSPSEVLQSAWDYAEQAVRELGNDSEDNKAMQFINPVSSLKDYIYNVERFALRGSEYDPSSVTNQEGTEENDKSNSNALNTFNKNILDEGSGEQQISNNPATAPVATSSSPSTINDQKNHMNGVMSAREFLTKDETTKGYTLQRIQNELPKLFKLDIRDNSTYGLRHLCYNLSILYVAGFWNRIPVENYNPNIKTFCIAYYNSWLNGSQKDQNGIPLNLDKIPSPDQVTDMARAKGMPLNPLAGGAQQGNNPVLNAPGDNNDHTEEESGTPFVIDENSLDDYDFDNQGSDNVMDRINEQARYVQESYGRSSTPEGANGEILINQPGSKIPAMALNNQNNLVVELKGDGKDEKLLFKLFNKSGYNEKMTDNILDDRRKSVIEAIKSRWGVNGVRVIRLENDELYVNGVMINIDKLKSPELGFRFNDIVRIEELLKTFRLTEKVEIDAVAFQSLVEVHYENVDVIVALFKIAPRLRVLVIQFSEGEPYDSIPRAKLGEFKKKIKKEIGAAEFKNRMKVATAIYNPRLGEKGVAGAHEAYKIAKSMGGNFVDALTAKHPSILKGTLYGALGAGALVGGLGLHAIGKAGNFFGNLGNKDK